MKNQILALLAVVTVSLASCSKDDLAPTPQNPSTTTDNERKTDCLTDIGIMSSDVTDANGTHLAVSVNWNNPTKGKKTIQITATNAATDTVYNNVIPVNTTGTGSTNFTLPDGAAYFISVKAYKGGNSNEPACDSVAGYHGN